MVLFVMHLSKVPMREIVNFNFHSYSEFILLIFTLPPTTVYKWSKTFQNDGSVIFKTYSKVSRCCTFRIALIQHNMRSRRHYLMVNLQVLDDGYYVCIL